VPTLEEVYLKAKFLYEQGPAHHKRKCHFGLVDVEAKARILNPDKNNRVDFITDATSASEFHQQKERYIEACGGNKTLGIHAMILLLGKISTEAIKGLIADGDNEQES
jgi:hypothetical protein